MKRIIVGIIAVVAVLGTYSCEKDTEGKMVFWWDSTKYTDDLYGKTITMIIDGEEIEELKVDSTIGYWDEAPKCTNESAWVYTHTLKRGKTVTVEYQIQDVDGLIQIANETIFTDVCVEVKVE